MGMSRKIVSATPRQLESLIRLSGGWGQGGGGGLSAYVQGVACAVALWPPCMLEKQLKDSSCSAEVGHLTIRTHPRCLDPPRPLPAEAQARMRLSDSVTVQDVNEAVRLMKVAMQQSSIDPRTGQIDMDVIQTGVSAADRTMKAQLVGELRTMLTHKVGGKWGLGWLWSEWVVGAGRRRGPKLVGGVLSRILK